MSATPSTDDSAKAATTMKFCPICRYYLYLNMTDSGKLSRQCRNCGHTEGEEGGGLVSFTNLEEKVNEGYKILVNEFTRLDPTLPHVDNIMCKNDDCPSIKGGKKPDVIYIKYDAVNMKFLYICNVCGEQWRSRS